MSSLMAGCSLIHHAESFKVKELRNPDNLTHEYPYYETKTTRYLSFKSKFKSLSNRLSESFAKQEYRGSDNITVSPLSIELCLGLAVRSASNETREELLKMFDVDFETFNEYYKLFFDEISVDCVNDLDQQVSSLEFTNSIWLDDEVRLVDEGLNDLKNDYYCHSFQGDFNGHNKETVEAMEKFIHERSHKLLNPKLDFSKETLFVLMNTLYLKDLWHDGGLDLGDAPKNVTFTNANGRVSDKRLLSSEYASGKMLKQEKYNSFFAETFSSFHLHFIVPNNGYHIKDIFVKETLDEVINLDNYPICNDELEENYFTNCYFPAFEANCDLDLSQMMINDFDIKTLFNEKCDFSNISKTNVYCDQFKQVAKLEVDSKGIEGAAVTYMSMSGNAGPNGYTNIYETLEVTKEFGFVLTNYFGDVIFSGIVSNID